MQCACAAIILSSVVCLVVPYFGRLSHKGHYFLQNIFIEHKTCADFLQTIFIEHKMCVDFLQNIFIEQNVC